MLFDYHANKLFMMAELKDGKTRLHSTVSGMDNIHNIQFIKCLSSALGDYLTESFKYITQFYKRDTPPQTAIILPLPKPSKDKMFNQPIVLTSCLEKLLEQLRIFV